MDVTEYKQFMGIDAFPKFEEESFEIDDSQEFCYAGKAIYDWQSRKHKLLLPSINQVPKFLLFHELTHILDAEKYSNGEKVHDFCLAGYMEYHASQVELMAMLGAKSVKDVLSFSMEDMAEDSEWNIRKYVENKLDTAEVLIGSSDQQKRVSGLAALYNFLGLRSVCAMYAKDYVDYYSYQEILTRLSSFLLVELRNFMSGWVEDMDKAVILYSHAYKAVTE